MNTGGQGMITATETFGSKALQHSTETHTSALAAAAKASVEAKYTMAIMRPRSVDNARVKTLQACARPKFAEAAKWSKPQGGKRIGGPSIRLAEELARNFGNIEIGSTTLVDDPIKRIIKVEVTDLESNLSVGHPITIAKTVERRDHGGRLVLGQRLNSSNETVYIVEATEDELLNKINAQTSKAMRVLILRLIPDDIVQEALAACEKTVREGATKDPAAAKKSLVDAFAAVGIMPRDLEAHLGHDLAQLQPAELADLRGIYAAVRDGEASWSDIVNQRAAEGDAPADATPKKATSALADQIRKSKKGKPEPVAAAPESKPADPVVEPPADPPPPVPTSVKSDEAAAAEIDRGDNPDAY